MVKVPCLTDQLTIWVEGVTNLISNFYMNLQYTRGSLQFHLMMIVQITPKTEHFRNTFQVLILGENGLIIKVRDMMAVLSKYRIVRHNVATYGGFIIYSIANTNEAPLAMCRLTLYALHCVLLLQITVLESYYPRLNGTFYTIYKENLNIMNEHQRINFTTLYQVKIKRRIITAFNLGVQSQ